ETRTGYIPKLARWITALVDPLPWLAQLSGTPVPDLGVDAGTHTAHALQELAALLRGEAPHLTSDAREALAFGCLFRAIGTAVTPRRPGNPLLELTYAETGCNYL